MAMHLKHSRKLQQDYGLRECPECGGNLSLFADFESDRLFECCHRAECSFENLIDEDEI